MNQKNNNMDLHVLKRFRQRFRVFFGQKDIENIVKLIVNCETEPIFQLSNSRRVHIVEYNGITFGCVYNKLRKYKKIGGFLNGRLSDYSRRK